MARFLYHMLYSIYYIIYRICVVLNIIYNILYITYYILCPAALEAKVLGARAYGSQIPLMHRFTAFEADRGQKKRRLLGSSGSVLGPRFPLKGSFEGDIRPYRAYAGFGHISHSSRGNPRKGEPRQPNKAHEELLGAVGPCGEDLASLMTGDLISRLSNGPYRASDGSLERIQIGLTV